VLSQDGITVDSRELLAALSPWGRLEICTSLKRECGQRVQKFEYPQFVQASLGWWVWAVVGTCCTQQNRKVVK
jgi:hypothetical protein